MGLNPLILSSIDSIALDGINNGAFPGCAILITKNGKIAFGKGYGNFTYGQTHPVTLHSVFDMASVTKIFATTLSVMKLYDEGLIHLDKRLGDYLPWVKNSGKESLLIRDILTHQAGLISFIPFYKEIIDSNGVPDPILFSPRRNNIYSVEVADQFYMQPRWIDTMYQRILQSPLEKQTKYIYSDNDFIFLGKIVEQLSGMTLDEYASMHFYKPLGMRATGFNAASRFSKNDIVPTEQEKIFRRQLLQGYVHDPGAAMFGGIAGHAGLFSNAADLALLAQMLLNGGTANGKRYLNKETIDLFSSYQSTISRRGLGFDKPEKDNATRTEPYPCKQAGPQTFGHTGFTGTSVWMDPANNLGFIFLSNRVHPQGDNRKLLNMNIRPKIHETIYRAMGL